MSFFKGDGGRDTLNGTVGADELVGFGGNDILNGFEGQNTLRGGDGFDTIKAGLGRDLVYGGDGDDLIEIKGNHGGTYIVAGFGRDNISLDRAKSGTTLSMDYDFEFSLDAVDSGLKGIEARIRDDSASIEKTDSSDDRTSDSIDGLLNLGPNGTLVLFGTPGDDEIEVDRDEGPMISYFAQGNDTFNGSTETYEEITFGASTIGDSADFGNRPVNEITITTSSSGQMSGRVKMNEGDAASGSDSSYTARFTGVDLVIGSNGDDIVTGSSGADYFRPGYGNDGFDGKRGSDTVDYDSKGVVSTVVDLLYRYGEATYSDEVLEDDFAGFDRKDAFFFEDKVQFDGLRSVENVVGTNQGSDVLRGSNGKNVLDGQGGDDIINGRKGNDTIIGGEGDDDLRGLAGRDRFVFDGTDGTDRIFRFEDGKDKLILTDGLAFGDVEVTQAGRHTMITFADSIVYLLGTDSDLISGADFIFEGA